MDPSAAVGPGSDGDALASRAALADAGAVLALFDARAATGKHALVP